MASVESIGSCSLDVDATASESSGTADGRTSSISQHTLRSASVDLVSGGSSIQGPVIVDLSHSPRSPKVTTAEISGVVGPTTSAPEIRYVSELYIPNGHQSHSAPEGCHEMNDQRKPSYINLSCSVSGYTSYSCYNSKVREELHSRDNSPARLAFCSEHNHVPGSTDHLQLLDIEVTENGEIKTSPNKKPTPTKLHKSSITLNVSSNGSDVVDRASRLSLYEEKRSSVWRASSESGIVSQQGHTNFTKSHEVCELYKNSNGSSLEQRSHHESSEILDNNDNEEYRNHGTSLRETKSLIQQRIERLYGPGALAQGFRIHRERKYSATLSEASSSPRSPHVSASLDSTPVFRHLSQRSSYDKLSNSTSPPFSLSKTPTNKQAKPNGSLGISVFTKLPNGTPGKIGDENEMLYVGGRTNGDISCKDEQIDICPDTQLIRTLSKEDIKSSLVKNGQWFIDAMNNEKEKIKSHIVKAEKILVNEKLSEDNCGRIRAAIGKANLLLSQKFIQFKGLCEKNLTQSVDEPFPTTVEDLAGFWDMVLIQVQEIYGLFDAITKARQRGWIFEEDMISVTNHKVTNALGVAGVIGVASNPVAGANKGRKMTKKATSGIPQRSSKSEDSAKAREEARRRLLEAKRKGRQTAFQADNSGIEIFVPEDKA